MGIGTNDDSGVIGEHERRSLDRLAADANRLRPGLVVCPACNDVHSDRPVACSVCGGRGTIKAAPCVHDFDMTMEYMSNPSVFKCRKCGAYAPIEPEPAPVILGQGDYAIEWPEWVSPATRASYTSLMQKLDQFRKDILKELGGK